jgi:hypothetical protein
MDSQAMKVLLVSLLIIALPSWAPGQNKSAAIGFQRRNDVAYVSPDQALRVRVHTDSHGESSARVEARDSHVLLMRDDTSTDGSHGYGVVHGAWTADSQFFVAGLESSGGHQPWAHPIWVYARASNSVVELRAIGLTVIADFQLRPPDILETRVPGPGGKGRNEGRSLRVSLHALHSRGTK